MKKYSSLIFVALIFFSCGRTYTPKPTGYFRIDLPPHEYVSFSGDCPFSFSYPAFARIVDDKSTNAEPCWLNIELTGYNGNIHLSYKPVRNNFNELVEDTRNLVYKHTIKADAISERFYTSPDEKVYGILYEIKGNAASNVQFFITDSIRHFMRGALYFNVQPNKDSLSPLIQHFTADISHLMETFAWE
jgi:gliding motility-associated lipoprotein GldD